MREGKAALKRTQSKRCRDRQPSKQKGERFPVRLSCSVAASRKSAANFSIPVVLRLVGAFNGHAEVVGLFLRELGELHADFFQV
jgi:hypothetical protein